MTNKSSSEDPNNAAVLKRGPMLLNKWYCCGATWERVRCVLYNDTRFLWYDNRTLKLRGGLILKNAPELIAYGPYTSRVPQRPSLPRSCEHKQLLAFGVRGRDKVYWFLCPNEAEVASWIDAISISFIPYWKPHLPPPSRGPYTEQFNSQPSAEYAPPFSQEHLPGYHLPSGIPGHYQEMVDYEPPPYQDKNSVRPQPCPSPNSGRTAVVCQNQPGYIYRGGGSGDFAMDMLHAGVIGTAWGSMHHYSGYGFGGGDIITEEMVPNVWCGTCDSDGGGFGVCDFSGFGSDTFGSGDCGGGGFDSGGGGFDSGGGGCDSGGGGCDSGGGGGDSGGGGGD